MYTSTSCCIRLGPSQWEMAIFDSHSSETPQPIFVCFLPRNVAQNRLTSIPRVPGIDHYSQLRVLYVILDHTFYTPCFGKAGSPPISNLSATIIAQWNNDVACVKVFYNQLVSLKLRQHFSEFRFLNTCILFGLKTCCLKL